MARLQCGPSKYHASEAILKADRGMLKILHFLLEIGSEDPKEKGPPTVIVQEPPGYGGPLFFCLHMMGALLFARIQHYALLVFPFLEVLAAHLVP